MSFRTEARGAAVVIDLHARHGQSASLPAIVERRDAAHKRRAIQSGKLATDLNLPTLDAKEDRVMVCGSPGMLADTRALLDSRGFAISPHIGEPGDYVIERAFVEK